MGAWIETSSVLVWAMDAGVAPYVGAWIETLLILLVFASNLSHPTWVRGLKLYLIIRTICPCHVAPYVGAWIEA